jgi:peroxiredoxin/gas vesicle protein
MKRNLILALALVAVLTASSTVLGQSQESRARPRVRANPSAGRQSPGFRQQVQRFQQQINKLQAEHNALINELKAIHAVATEEKANKTAGTVERLISQRQETFKGQMERLKRQQQRVQQAAMQRTDRSERPRRGGKQAPDLTLTRFDGKTFKLAEHKGKIVVLEWFSSKCPFSKYHYETKSTMADLAKKYKDKDVVWLAVNSTSNSSPETNVAFAKRHKLPYPIIDDRSGVVGRTFKARTTPHMIVVSKGTIVYDGAIDNAPMGKVKGGLAQVNYVDRVLSQLTSGQPVSQASTQPYGCSVKYKR